MTDPISDFDLNAIRTMVTADTGAFYGKIESYLGTISPDDVAEIIARLDAAEAKLARIAKLLAPRDYIALPTLIVIKEIVDG